MSRVIQGRQNCNQNLDHCARGVVRCHHETPCARSRVARLRPACGGHPWRQESPLAETSPSLLVVSAHAGDFVWRAGGAIAAAVMRGERAVVVCLSYGERGESASQWLQGKSLEEIKAVRRGEAEAAASALGAEIEFLDLGDYPLVESSEAIAQLVDVYRRVQPTVVLTHALADPYNGDHPAAARMALQ